MNTVMAYLVGMISGNGEVKRGAVNTIISIEIPHKKMRTEENQDVRVYVKASITDIRAILEPLIGAELQCVQQDNVSILSFSKPNADFLIWTILQYIGNATSHENIRIDRTVFNFSKDERISFLRGFSDVTGYIRRSNYYFRNYCHRVYLEVPHNWFLVADVCNLLKSVDVPVQTIDWAHPNMRDGKLTKLNQGYPNFWKKEHQIKIWANEFEPIGFAVIHKRESLSKLISELRGGFISDGKDVSSVTHRYYWETHGHEKSRPHHSGESDSFIPIEIRGKHYSSWKEIARDLGYHEDT